MECTSFQGWKDLGLMCLFSSQRFWGVAERMCNMDVGSVSGGFCASYGARATKKSESVFSLEAGAKGFSNELDLYYDICKDYPEVSFRLDDLQGDGEITSDFSFHQTRDGYGEPGTISITMDANLLKKALTDKTLEENLRGEVKTVVYNYHNITRPGSDDYAYHDVLIGEDGGEFQLSTRGSGSPYSTDEQLKQMWHVTNSMDEKGLMRLIRDMQQATTEQLFEMQRYHATHLDNNKNPD